MTADIKDYPQGPKRTQKSLDSVSQFPAFFTNDHHAYAARKSERLASAVHVVTGFMAREEPVRSMLRTGSLEVVQLATDLSRLRDVGPESFTARCAEISALLETAQSASLVSSMNAKLIVDEYASLANFVRDRYALLRAPVQHISDTQPPDMSFKPTKDISSFRNTYRTAAKDTPPASNSSRRDEILNLISQKDRISIKDASQFITGVSEKTLQRELLSMVSEGLLIKEGERRWSTYKRAPSRLSEGSVVAP